MKGNITMGQFALQSCWVEIPQWTYLERFGPSVEPPNFPFHAIIWRNVTLAIELTDVDSLRGTKSQLQSEIFAKQESLIMVDRTGELKKRKDTAFQRTDDEIKQRALTYHRWLDYVSNKYHYEKWAYRKSWIQLSHNLSVACECCCSFLFCRNGSFVPRRDWIVYLTYELPLKPNNYDQLIHSMYHSLANEKDIAHRADASRIANEWMITYCKTKDWMTWEWLRPTWRWSWPRRGHLNRIVLVADGIVQLGSARQLSLSL